jgi:hypothetical protein
LLFCLQEKNTGKKPKGKKKVKKYEEKNDEMQLM